MMQLPIIHKNFCIYNTSKNSLFLKIFLVISVIASSFFPFSAKAGDISGLRNQRYCEIIISAPHQLIPTQMQVYNTIGLNDCPLDLWNKISAQEIRKETHASRVELNGPRYWTIDGLKNSSLINPQPKTLGGMTMREAGVLKLNLRNLLAGQTSYVKHDVHRETTWIYQSGKPIYEIINSQGEIFVMQSYSTQKIMQTEASLSELGSKLHLPKNWSFRTRMLSKNAYLTPINQNAVVIQDDYLNTYQQETPDFITETKAIPNK